MALTIETGAIIPGANSYATVIEADAYLTFHAQRVAWAALATPDKEAALVQSARVLDSQVLWKGSRMSITQPMEWPRYGVTLPLQGSEGSFPDNAVPVPVKEAQIELAALMMAGDRTADSDSAGIKAVGLGKGALSVEFDPTTAATMLGRIVPSKLRDYIKGVAESRFRLTPVRRA